MTTKKEVRRVTQEMTARLHALGVPVLPSDSPEDIVSIIEAIEVFETAVEDAGGDLMVDEPPRGSRPQPDRPDLVLPARADGEPANLYRERLERAAELIAE